MTNLQHRIERLEQRTSAKEERMVLVVARAGVKIGPDQRQYIDNLAGRATGMVLVDLKRLPRKEATSK